MAVIVPTKFEFSSILKNWPEVISGATSFTLVTLMVRFLSVALVPSDAVAMMLNVSFASKSGGSLKVKIPELSSRLKLAASVPVRL